MKKSKKSIILVLGITVCLLAGVTFLGTKNGTKTENEDKNGRAQIVNKIAPTNAVYAETLNDIQTEMNKLMPEIEAAMKNNPEIAMQSHPGTFIKNSKSYQNIVGLGLKAVKPLYDTLYESREAGLYEYILSMAIQDITGEKFVYNVNYGWKNSLEFRMAYEEKVNNVKLNVERIIADTNLNDEEKTQKLTEQGIFAVSSLLKEYSNGDSKVNKDVIKKAVLSITNKDKSVISGERSAKTIDDISGNKELFDSLVDLNGKAYK